MGLLLMNSILDEVSYIRAILYADLNTVYLISDILAVANLLNFMLLIMPPFCKMQHPPGI